MPEQPLGLMVRALDSLVFADINGVVILPKALETLNQ